MMQLLMDWLYSVRVCVKYKIVWNPLCSRRRGSYTFSYCFYKSGEREILKERIHVSPFYKNFIQTFMHEVGHLAYHRKLVKCSTDGDAYEQAVKDFMKDEYLAWRFSKLVLGNRFNKPWAKHCFSTYFRSFKKEVGMEKAVSVYSNYDMRIGK